jgi:hypothetical protein
VRAPRAKRREVQIVLVEPNLYTARIGSIWVGSASRRFFDPTPLPAKFCCGRARMCVERQSVGSESRRSLKLAITSSRVLLARRVLGRSGRAKHGPQ